MPVEEIGSLETWQRLTDDPDAVLIDVRTPMEWLQIGIPDLAALATELGL